MDREMDRKDIRIAVLVDADTFMEISQEALECGLSHSAYLRMLHKQRVAVKRTAEAWEQSAPISRIGEVQKRR